MPNNDLMYCQHDNQVSWWEVDARGIPLARVCDKCRKTKLSQYRYDVLHNSDYESDEPIGEDFPY